MIIKCKMCGGDLHIDPENQVAECEYCGSKQTVPTADDEKKMTLFGRAGRLLRGCEFDKAAGVFETIVADFPEEAEAYWGLVLCKYGIEYVDDPATGKKIPTCHRSSFDSVLDDDNFAQACENASLIAKRVYRDEAKAIEDLRKGIIEVSGKEEPYDIFICYKETDENGERTLDSVLAQDVYDALTERGYRVFFSRVTLENKLGQEYEPYIFAALHSAKIMLAFGTQFEYYDAVWVKNEWSRFLALIAAGEKKTLIPCYKNLDAYDMPKEFAKLQAQDMGKVGAMQDLLRGIEKILPRKTERVPAAAAAPAANATVAPLLKRAFMFLEDGDWQSADEYCEKVLDQDPENAEAYLGKLMAELKVRKRDALKDCAEPFDGSKNYEKALRFGGDALKAELKHYLANVKKAAEQRVKERREKLLPVQNQIAAAEFHTVGLKSNGTVAAAGSNVFGQCNVSGWTDIVAIAAGSEHTVGLKADGTVVAVGDNLYGRCNVSGWTDIAAIAAGYSHTVGLKADGTVVATEYTGDQKYYSGQCGVSGWRDIAAIAVGDYHTVGLKSDGTVMAVGENDDGQCNVSDWTDIVAIAAGSRHTVGLKSDGTVVATKYTGIQKFYSGQCDVSGWTDIVAIAAGSRHTVGLKSDGTVVATKYTGDQKYNRSQCDVSGWTDIVAIAAGDYRTVGLKADGTVVAMKYTGDQKYNYGQCDVSGWKLFGSIDTLEQEREAAKKAAEERRIAEEKAVEERRLAAKKAAEERRLAAKKAAEERRIAAEKAEAERKAAEAAEAARIARERAEKKTKLESEQSQLQTELANLKGLFTGKRRKEIEARLAAIASELKTLA